MGGKSVIMKTFKVDEAMAIIEKESITSVVAVPTIYWLMLVSPSFKKYNLTSLRTICYGGAAASPELIVQLSKEFPKAKLINAGGLTEGTSGQYALPAEDGLRKAGAVGLPMPCTELRVVGEHGEDLPPGQVGEMILKGPGICKGYWKKPEATAKSFKDGWLYTGDLAKIDEEGYVWLVDRKTDMIIRGGENIYSIEVENILYFHPKVLEAAVVGVPDKIFGEEVKAFLYLKEGESADEEEIRDHCRKYLADYKVPKYIEFLKEPLPRNPGGKVIKAALRK
jgi:acyl-CoA synthetase (AMP-forming)/AMP-acid ligase II